MLSLRDGMGSGWAGKFFRRRRRRRRRRRPPKKGLFGKIQILSILTHSRAMNFLASPYESYGRGGSFLCSKVRGISLEFFKYFKK